MWPPQPDMIPRLEAWLEEANDLAARLPVRRGQLEELLSRGDLDRDQILRRDLLETFVTELEVFLLADPHAASLESVRQRLETARSLDSMSSPGGEVAAAWKVAATDVGGSEVYAGLALKPQWGLVPLRRDPRSGLWEFWHVLSGERPLPESATGSPGPWKIEEGTGVVLVLLPGGRFRMGSQSSDAEASNHVPPELSRPGEAPVNEVELSPFFVSKYELTQGQWRRLTGVNPSRYCRETFRPYEISLAHPVENVAFRDVEQTLSRCGLSAPTEAQWEYAARGATDQPWWTGASKESIATLNAANLADARTRAGNPTLKWSFEEWEDAWSVHAPVGNFAPNPFGLHDVIGNVMELCRDCWVDYDDEEFPPRPGDGLRQVNDKEGRIMRGGAFMHGAAPSRVAARYSVPPLQPNNSVGVRPTRELDR